MAIKRTTPTNVIMQYMRDELSAYERVIIRRLSYAGEMCVIQAREHGSYTDRSGNLRSSIGYVIVRNGQILTSSGFKQIREGVEGVADGQKFAKELASKFTKGIALIVVAGMEYAAAVESGRRKNSKGEYYYVTAKDVLTSSEMLAKQLVPELMRKLGIDKTKSK